MKLTYIARVVNGILLVRNKARMQKELANTLEGKWVNLVIEKKKRKRTGQQNRYYWGVLIPVAREAFVDAGNYGVTNEEVHEFLKKRFLDNGRDIMLPGGELTKGDPTTTTLTIGEEMEYFMNVKAFLLDYFNTEVPEPEGQSELNV